MSHTEDRRSEQRLQRSEPVTINVTASDDAELVGTSFQCTTTDISSIGMRLKTERNLPLMTAVEICVGIHGMQCKYFLKGQVIYSSAAEQDGWFYQGIKLDDKPTADMLSWSELFNE